MLSELKSQYQGNDIMYFNEIRFLEWILNEGVTPGQAESASRSREKNTKKLKTRNRKDQKKKKSLQNLTLISSRL